MANRLIVIALCITTIFALRMHHTEQSKTYNNSVPRLRRSIHALNETARKSFFWSLKALAVLPAPQSYKQWNFEYFISNGADDLQQRKLFSLRPRCLHDILIASHTSAAQHRVFYFIAFHRHWLSLYEIWLCFAHDVLRGGKQKLLEHYPQEFYQKYSKFWDRVFEDYQTEGMANISEMAAHYWNPSNYKNKYDILFPQQLATPKDINTVKLDSMDHLLFAVREHYAWELNVRTRMASDRYQYNASDIEERLRNSGYLNQKNLQASYSNDQINLLKGKLSARNQPQGQNFGIFNQTFENYLTDQGNGDYQIQSKFRLEQYFKGYGNKERLLINNLTDQETFVNFGAEAIQLVDGEKKLVKHSYISKAQRRALNLPYHSANYFNHRLPSYDYAYAQFNKLNVPSFVDFNTHYKGLGNAHSRTHNFHGNSQQIMGLNIYVFHGWIECQVQMRIRALNHEDQANGNKKQYETFLNYLKNFPRQKQNSMYKMMSQSARNQQERDLYHQLMQQQLRKFYESLKKINGSEFKQPLGVNQTGYHGVLQWLNPYVGTFIQTRSFDPKIPNSTIVFPFRDLMLTPTHIRTTHDLSQIYNRIYIPLSGHRFKGYVDLTKHRFNVDYQIYNGPGEPLQILDRAASNIPKYRQMMRQDTEIQTYDIFDNNLNSTIDYIYHYNYKLFNNLDPKLDELYRLNSNENYQQIKSYLIDYYTSYLHNQTYSFAQYPASTPSGVYQIRMKINSSLDCTEDLKKQLSQYGLSEENIDKIMNQGITIQNLTINNDATCKDCPLRKIYLDSDADLLQTNFDLWKSLRLIMTGKDEILLKAYAQTSFSQCFANNIKLFVQKTQGKKSQSIEVWPVRGVQEFVIVAELKDGAKVDGSLEVSAIVQAGDRPNQTIHNSVQHSNEVAGSKFVFPRLEHSSNGAIKNDLQVYLYRKIKVKLIRPFRAAEAEFDIPHYSMRGTYKMVFDSKGSIQLEDMDHHVKRRLLDAYVNSI